MHHYHLRLMCYVPAGLLDNSPAYSYECCTRVDMPNTIEYASDITDIETWAFVNLGKGTYEVLEWRELKGQQRPHSS